MKRYRIQVRVPVMRQTAFGEVPTDRHQWVYGRPTNGQPYEYITREQAEAAARLWGDAYTTGDVRVVEYHPGESS